VRPVRRLFDLESGPLIVRVCLIPLDSIRPHEMAREERLSELEREIREDGRLRVPVLVDGGSGALLDGHHRVEALRRMGARLAPAALVDYRSPGISVEPRRVDRPVSKELVVRTAREGGLMPPKTTRHVLQLELPEVGVRLEDLGVRMDGGPGRSPEG